MTRARAVLFIAIAATIWSLDSFFRFPSLESFHPTTIVFLDHFFGLFTIAPFFFVQRKEAIRKLKPRHLPAILIVGIVGSSLAEVFNAKSLEYLGPSTVNTFQFLQPLAVLTLAYLFLRERENGNFLQLAVWILLGAGVLCAPDMTFGFSSLHPDRFWFGVMYGLLAAVLWGCSTVAGKWLLQFYSPIAVIFLRWLTAVIALSVYMGTKGISFGFTQPDFWKFLPGILTLATILGVFPYWFYYRGLQKLPASVATFIELLYPLCGIFFPVLLHHHKLLDLQWVGGFLVFLGILFLVLLELGFGPTRRSRQ